MSDKKNVFQQNYHKSEASSRCNIPTSVLKYFWQLNNVLWENQTFFFLRVELGKAETVYFLTSISGNCSKVRTVSFSFHVNTVSSVQTSILLWDLLKKVV